MSGECVLLLPPSEGKAAGPGRGRRTGAFEAQLADRRAEVLGALATELSNLSPARAARLFNARGELLEAAVARAAAIVAGEAPTMAAWRRYTGVVWQHLEPSARGEDQLRRCFVPSSLYGLSSALDPIADYRLSMSVALGSLGRLSGFWREAVTASLLRAARGREIVDLLPKDYAAAVDFAQLESRLAVLRVRFVSADGKAAIGHGAKAVKGRLAAHLLTEGLEAAAGFCWEGWRARRTPTGLIVTAPSAAHGDVGARQ
jgi:cytoplasmic iron level regulating protein YaaA (DUF328/UPF0246 family)